MNGQELIKKIEELELKLQITLKELAEKTENQITGWDQRTQDLERRIRAIELSLNQLINDLAGKPYCAHCDAELKPGYRFCGNCGFERPLVQKEMLEGVLEEETVFSVPAIPPEGELPEPKPQVTVESEEYGILEEGTIISAGGYCASCEGWGKPLKVCEGVLLCESCITERSVPDVPSITKLEDTLTPIEKIKSKLVDFEITVGKDLFQKIGVIAILIGIVYVLRWITPEELRDYVELGCAYSCGILMLAWGYIHKKLDKKDIFEVYENTIMSGGLAVEFVSLFMTRFYYGFVTTDQFLLGSTLIFLVGAGLSFHFTSGEFAVTSLLISLFNFLYASLSAANAVSLAIYSVNLGMLSVLSIYRPIEYLKSATPFSYLLVSLYSVYLLSKSYFEALCIIYFCVTLLSSAWGKKTKWCTLNALSSLLLFTIAAVAKDSSVGVLLFLCSIGCYQLLAITFDDQKLCYYTAFSALVLVNILIFTLDKDYIVPLALMGTISVSSFAAIWLEVPIANYFRLSAVGYAAVILYSGRHVFVVVSITAVIVVIAFAAFVLFKVQNDADRTYLYLYSGLFYMGLLFIFLEYFELYFPIFALIFLVVQRVNLQIRDNAYDIITSALAFLNLAIHTLMRSRLVNITSELLVYPWLLFYILYFGWTRQKVQGREFDIKSHTLRLIIWYLSLVVIIGTLDLKDNLIVNDMCFLSAALLIIYSVLKQIQDLNTSHDEVADKYSVLNSFIRQIRDLNSLLEAVTGVYLAAIGTYLTYVVLVQFNKLARPTETLLLLFTLFTCLGVITNRSEAIAANFIPAYVVMAFLLRDVPYSHEILLLIYPTILLTYFILNKMDEGYVFSLCSGYIMLAVAHWYHSARMAHNILISALFLFYVILLNVLLHKTDIPEKTRGVVYLITLSAMIFMPISSIYSLSMFVTSLLLLGSSYTLKDEKLFVLTMTISFPTFEYFISQITESKHMFLGAFLLALSYLLFSYLYETKFRQKTFTPYLVIYGSVCSIVFSGLYLNFAIATEAIWTFIGAVVIILGFKLDIRYSRVLGTFGYIPLSVVKLCVDIWSIGDVGRALVPLILGFLLVFISYVYTKYGSQLIAKKYDE